MAGDESGHSPENDASFGFVQTPATFLDSRITVQCAALRVKNSVCPSGEKVGDPSFSGPEMMPGANNSGAAPKTADVELCAKAADLS